MKIVRKIVRRILKNIDIVPFLIRNIYMSSSLHTFQEEIEDGIIYRGLKQIDFKAIRHHYSLLPNGRSLRWSRMVLYRIAGEKLVIVGEEESTGQIIGIQMFYFNKRDIKENTIHSTYTGILPERQGKGLGKAFALPALRF